ncbi:MAG: hypothetical protein E6X17_05130 [Sporomusaceae bacterium]|nr:hypothetical protein [Sporomusaceae bacterium]
MEDMNKIKVRVGYFEEFTEEIDSETLRMFKLALEIKHETASEVLEKMMRLYVSNTFAEASKKIVGDSENNNVAENVEEKYFAKALGKIPKWAFNRDLVPHKIISAFLYLQNAHENVDYSMLEQRCTDINWPHNYVEQFAANFNQMKVDNQRSYGKVFTVDKATSVVSIWDEVSEKIIEYKERFLHNDEQE